MAIPTQLISVHIGKVRAAVMPMDGWPAVHWCIEPLVFAEVEADAIAQAIDTCLRAAPRLRTYLGSEDLRNYKSPLQLHFSEQEYRAFLKGNRLFQLGRLGEGEWNIKMLKSVGKGRFELVGEAVVVRAPTSRDLSAWLLSQTKKPA